MPTHYNAAGENIHTLHTRERTAEELAEALGAKPEGKGWRAHCPICKNRALAIDPGDTAETVVNCLTGCNQDSVLDALREEGLWPRRSRRTKWNGQKRGRNSWRGKVGEDARKRKAGGDPKRPEQEEATKQAQAIWNDSKPASEEHPYLAHKKAPPHGLKQASLSTVKEELGYPPKADGEPMEGPLLVIPIHANSGTLKGVQLIDRGGRKTLPKGTPKKGHYHLIGEPEDGIYIAEGYATAASIYEADGEAVAVAFDAGNLKSVAQNLKTRYPDAELIFCADDDADKEAEGKKNAGLEAAREAARAVGGSIVIPPREEEGIKRDFNDLAIEEGIEAVQEALRKPEAPEPEESPEKRPELKDFFLTSHEIRKRYTKPPPPLVSPWLRAGEYTLIYGPKGIGKSWLMYTLTYLAGREDPEEGPHLGPWRIRRSPEILYLDTEMGGWEINKRDRALEWTGDNPKKRYFDLRDWQQQTGEAVDLSEPAWQNALLEAVQLEAYQALVIDGVSLVFNLDDENSNSEWNDKVTPFINACKGREIALVLIDHTGKESSRGARGCYAKTVPAENVIRLEAAKDRKPHEAHFTITHEHGRGGKDAWFAPFTLRFYELDNGDTEWEVTEGTSTRGEDEKLEVIAELVRGRTQTETAKRLQKTQPWVSQIKKKEAIEWGYLDKDGKPTAKGRALAEEYPPPEPGSGG